MRPLGKYIETRIKKMSEEDKSIKMIHAVNLVMAKIAADMIKEGDALEATGEWTIKEADIITFIAMMTAVKLGKNSMSTEIFALAEKASDELLKELREAMNSVENFINARGNPSVN